MSAQQPKIIDTTEREKEVYEFLSDHDDDSFEEFDD